MKKNNNTTSVLFRHRPLITRFTGFKSLKIQLAIALLVLSMTILDACTKFLTQDLKGEFSTSTFYQNDKQALQALTGVYSAISFNNFDNAIWVFGDVASMMQ